MKHTRSLLKVIGIACMMLCAPRSYSQDILSPLGTKKSIQINFVFVQGFIIVDLVFERLFPMKFIYDTGAQNTILFDRIFTDNFQSNYSKRINLLGADLSSEFYALIYRNASIEIKGASRVNRDILVLEENFINISELIGLNVHGIIGSEFFKNHVVEIDFDKHQLVISKCEVVREGKFSKYAEIPIELNASKPYINARISLNLQDTITVKLLVDTGASLTSMIQTNTHPLLKLPEKTIPSRIGHGFGGNIEGYVGKIGYFEIQDFKFQNLLSYFQTTDGFVLDQNLTKRNGLLGNNILDRFKVAIDYCNSKMYLKPSSKHYDKPFEYDKSGLIVYAYGDRLNQYIIRYVSPGSPAAEADIRVDDQILKIGCFPLSLFSLDEISNKLSKKAGTKVKLKLRRGKEEFSKSIVLRDLI